VAHGIVTRESPSALARRVGVEASSGNVGRGSRWLVVAILAAACGWPPETAVAESAIAAGSTCATGPMPAAYAPGVDASLESAAAWTREDTTVLADASRLAAHALAVAALPGGAVDPWDPAIEPARALVDARIRLVRLRQDIRDGITQALDGGGLAEAQARIDGATVVDHARLVVQPTQLYCTASSTTIVSLPGRDPAFDRNLCTSLHPGELVRVLARADGGRWTLVHAGHTAGWVQDGLSERLAEPTRLAWRAAPRVWSLADDVTTEGGVAVPLGVGLPLVDDRGDRIAVRVAGAEGPVEDTLRADAAVTIGAAPLRRGSVVATALAQLGAPYGWGGRGGHRDCSQFLRDVFMPYGVALPRHSSTQADAGFTTIDVAGWTAAAKLDAIDTHGERGLVLEYMPGHVMLDLGEKDGRRFSISAIAEFVTPCSDGQGETLHRLDRVAVTDLETGRGTSRGAFIDRITKLAVFGPPK
jgi:hypothetical protein